MIQFENIKISVYLYNQKDLPLPFFLTSYTSKYLLKNVILFEIEK